MSTIAFHKHSARKGRSWGQIFLHLVFILCLCYVLPLMLVFSVAS